MSARKRLHPCTVCRDRHLKCDSHSPCLNCQKSDTDCVRPSKRFRFKQKHNEILSFSADQTWMKTRSRQGGLSYVDETEEVARTSGHPNSSENTGPNTPQETLGGSPSSQSRADFHHNDTYGIAVTNSPLSPAVSRDHFQRSPGSASITSPTALDPQLQMVSTGRYSDHSHAQVSSLSPSDSFRASNYSNRHVVSNILSPTLSVPTSHSNAGMRILHRTLSSTNTTFPITGESRGATYVGLQEACLIRHFVENLAHSFDTTDRHAHFTRTVPQRAMHNPVLLYAVCTASARHLTRVWGKTHPNQTVEYQGTSLPDLNEDSAIHYHNLCISLLIDFSNDPSHTPSEEALAAATILRFYEQIDTSLTGLDSETYLNVVQTVINSQQTDTTYSLLSIEELSSNDDVPATQGHGLHYSARLIALRQEIWSVLLYRRPFRLPLNPHNNYQNLQSADEFVWVNRIFIWCADILRFCFGIDYQGEDATSDSRSKVEQWQALKAFEETWSTTQPPCFKPLYFAAADPEQGNYFPIIWQTNDCQTMGIQQLELGRMLLWVYDPRRQLLGIGSRATNHDLETRLRKSILKLCGLALSNKRFQAGMTTAAVGISLFGESFYDPGEQKAIINFMGILETEHAWPTAKIVEALHIAWDFQVGSAKTPIEMRRVSL